VGIRDVEPHTAGARGADFYIEARAHLAHDLMEQPNMSNELRDGLGDEECADVVRQRRKFLGGNALVRLTELIVIFLADALCILVTD
jgi:hypothetical protein